MIRLMIVEDNKYLSESYKKFLTKDENISVVATAYDGRTALKLYKEIQPDLVLLDLGLPEISGLEVIERLSAYEENDKKCNIIVITGDSTLKHKLCTAKKVFSVLDKPVNFDKILYSINDFILENGNNQFPIKKLHTLLFQCSVNIHSISCVHLIDVVKYSYYNPHKLQNIADIYKILSFTYKCSPDSIRSSVRSSIRVIGKNGSKKMLEEIFYVTKHNYNCVLSPVHFVECILDYLEE